jgi:hypothetical protein
MDVANLEPNVLLRERRWWRVHDVLETLRRGQLAL